MDMENETAYTVVAYNHTYVGSLAALEVFKTTSKVEACNNWLTVIIRNGLSTIRIPFTETIEEDKTYYRCQEERAITTNRATPIEAMRDALSLLTQKNPTAFEQHHLSTVMGKIISTLRRMYQEENISNVAFVMSNNQKYFITYQNMEGDLITVHDDFRQ